MENTMNVIKAKAAKLIQKNGQMLLEFHPPQEQHINFKRLPHYAAGAPDKSLNCSLVKQLLQILLRCGDGGNSKIINKIIQYIW